MTVAECPKIFDVQCIWGKIFVSLGKAFVFKYLQTIFHLVFKWNIMESVTRNYTKIYLDAALWTKRSLPSLTRPTQKSLNQLLAFLNLYEHTKNQYATEANFRVSWLDWPYPFLTSPTQKNFDQLLIFVNLYQHAKNQFIPSVHSSDKVNFKVPSHDWPHPFLTMPTPETFKLIFTKLYQYAKNKLIPSFNSILDSSDQIGHINMLKMRLFH